MTTDSKYIAKRLEQILSPHEYHKDLECICKGDIENVKKLDLKAYNSKEVVNALVMCFEKFIYKKDALLAQGKTLNEIIEETRNYDDTMNYVNNIYK